jgi:DNA-binding NtrC family response regulator
MPRSAAQDRMVKVLIVDDDPQSLRLSAAAIEDEGLEIITVDHPQEALRLAHKAHPQIALLDLRMPSMSGIELMERLIAHDPNIDVILITAHSSTESAVEAIQKGASDYFNKPISVQRLRDRVHKLAEDARQRLRRAEIERTSIDIYQFENMIGRSAAMLDVFVQLRRIAPHFRTILVSGPTGSGKELVARALHQLSPVARGPFAACNCSAIVESLFESELFGYVKGAFTGANADKIGLFEYANNGTVFLDEIGDMPLATQAKLLRVLQTQEIQRVGSPAVRKINVRVIAATNRDLKEMVAEKLFREDLYYRLAAIEVKLPALKDRMEDVPLLARYFLARYSKEYHKSVSFISRRAEAMLSRYDWPGNIRQLESAIAHACMMSSNETLDVEDFQEEFRNAGRRESGGMKTDMVSMDQMQRIHARNVMEKVGGNKSRAADILGISRVTLYKLLAGSGDGAGES